MISDIYIGLVLLLAIDGIALAYERWVGHALIAIVSLLMMIYTVTTGAMLKGRITRSSGNVFRLHKRGGIYFGAFILGSFIYGLWIKLQHGESILSSVHGKLGLVILLIVFLQLFRFRCKKSGYFTKPLKTFTIRKVNHSHHPEK